MSQTMTKHPEERNLVIIEDTDGDSDIIKSDVKEECDDTKNSQRENRLTSIIDQLHCQSKMKGNAQRDNVTFAPSNGEPGGGAARRCARDAASPAHAHAPPPAPPAPSHAAHQVKSERLSPHDSNASRSRSVTPSTSSYPDTPPERGSPHAPPAPAHPSRNYSDIMRSLAARYNTHPSNDYFHRVNGYGVERTPAPTQADGSDVVVGGLFAKLAKQQGGLLRLPAFPVMLDMSSTKNLLAIARVSRGGRSRHKRVGAGVTTEHSPLDLSAAGESAAKRARLSASPSTRSDGDERVSNEDRSENRECLCSEARARLSAMTVDDVCEFVSSIDICAEYAANFHEQRIDGAGLPLLTEEHLTGMLKMKLGPALKLRAVVARRLEPCVQCQTASPPAAAVPAPPVPPKVNGTSLKSEPRSNTTSPS